MILTKHTRDIELFIYQILDSTSLEAKRKITEKYQTPFAILAFEQTHGYGKFNRSWESYKGNFFYTIVLDTPIEKKYLIHELAIVIALTIYKTLLSFNKILGNIQFKWPNDLLINKKKLGGILIETFEDKIVIGIGINLKNFPENLPYPATSIYHEFKIEIDNKDLAYCINHYINEEITIWNKKAFKEYLVEYRKNLFGINQEVRLQTKSEIIKGIMRDINGHGFLIVEKKDGSTLPISAADVFFT